ncbi:MAG: hypothetical protein ACK5KT_09675 [Dysgonomonas sp.]
MKTILFKVLGAFFAVSLLTSCLGSKDSYLENKSGEFAYFKYDNFGNGDKLYAYISAGPILVPNSLTGSVVEGRGYFVKYKITLSGSYYYNAEYLELLGNGEAVPTAAFKWDAPYTGFQPTLVTDSIHPLNLNIGAGSSTASIDDNWLVSYNVPLKEDENVEARFYYDPNGQYENGTALAKNQAIIDVRFVKTDKNTENGNTTNETLYALGSLKEFRASYQADFTEATSQGLDYVFVPIKFRYVAASQQEGIPPSIKTLGSFSLTSTSDYVYYMQFNKSK